MTAERQREKNVAPKYHVHVHHVTRGGDPLTWFLSNLRETLDNILYIKGRQVPCFYFPHSNYDTTSITTGLNFPHVVFFYSFEIYSFISGHYSD